MPTSPSGIDRNLTHYGDPGFSRYLRRVFLASAGFDEADLDRPVVGIADTSSDYTTCHRDMPQLVEAVKRGVLEAGGLPLVFPTLSLGELLLSPTAMLFRNLMAMATEEMIAAQPMDAVVLLGGCDKTLPAQLMASASASVPAIHLVAGPMLTGDWRGERLGACTDCRRYWAQHRAGALDAEEIAAVRQSLCPTAGTCMVMGTASTMACVAEALGMMLPGAATPPAVSSQRLRLGVATGRRAVALATGGTPARDILTPGAFANALKVLAALSGSTNAVVHLLAIARRAGWTCRWTTSTRLPDRCRCWSIASRRAPDTWRISTRPEGCPSCSRRWSRCSTSMRRESAAKPSARSCRTLPRPPRGRPRSAPWMSLWVRPRPSWC